MIIQCSRCSHLLLFFFVCQVLTHNKIRREVFESELEHITTRGAESRLKKHQEQTGIQASPALRKLAADTDQISQPLPLPSLLLWFY